MVWTMNWRQARAFALRLVVRNAFVREFLKLAKVPNFLLSMASEVKVVAYSKADPLFMNENMKAIFF